MTAGDILFLENVTVPTGSGYSASDFDDKTFMITSVVDWYFSYYYYGIQCQRNGYRWRPVQLNGTIP